jgi:hypothetical protein
LLSSIHRRRDELCIGAMQAQQNKGTLVPGQIITVNQYQVQVEKYLSQGSSLK